MKKIKIITHKVKESLCGHVRLAPEAETRLRELCRESGLSARCIVSQIVLQAADFVEFAVEEKNENN